MRSLRAEHGFPLICGHRGSAATHHENTLPSIAAALDGGVDAIEIDIHFAADRQPVVVHDATLERTTNGRGPVRSLTSARLAQLDAGDGAGVPALDDVLALAASRVRVLIEVKATYEDHPWAVDAIADVVRRRDAVRASALLAFDHRHLVDAARRQPDLDRVALCVHAPARVAAVLDRTGATALAPLWSSVDSNLVAAVHGYGCSVVAWTVDDPDRARELARMGVDVLISNDPAELLRRLRPGVAGGDQVSR